MVYRCNTIKEKGCSVCCVLALLLALVATTFTHIALSKFVPAVKDLPDNIVSGFNTVLNFGTLEADAKRLKNASSSALAKCSVTAATGCASPPTGGTSTSNPGAELTTIQNVFDNSLKTVQTVANDKYLGLKDFNQTGQELNKMSADIKDLVAAVNGTSVPCSSTNALFCGIYKNSEVIINSVKPVKDGINKIVESDGVKAYTDYADYLKYLHAMAYVFWLALLFYLCFFISKKPKCICRGGSGRGCCACCGNSVFFLVFWVLTLLIVGAGYVMIWFASDYKIKEPLRTEATVKDVIDHIETAFPGFYDLVLKDLLLGMRRLLTAFTIFLVVDIMFLVHQCTTCCCGIYGEPEVDELSGEAKEICEATHV